MGHRAKVIAVVIGFGSASAFADTWNNRSTPTNPGSRDGALIAYDSFRDRAILYGGHQTATCGAAQLTKTWSYDYGANTWTDLMPTTNPGQHGHSGMTYDSVNDRVLVFGSTDYPCAVTAADNHL